MRCSFFSLIGIGINALLRHASLKPSLHAARSTDLVAMYSNVHLSARRVADLQIQIQQYFKNQFLGIYYRNKTPLPVSSLFHRYSSATSVRIVIPTT
jgi:hypothetical protein